MSEKPHLVSAQELGIANVLDVVTRIYGLEGTPRGDEFDMLCPDPAHEDRRPSTSVNLVTGYWHCFSCGRGGDLIGLGVRVLGKVRDDVLELLRPNSVDSLVAILNSKRITRRRKRTHLNVPVPSDYADGPLDELIERGFTMESLRKWSVRYVPSAELQGQRGAFNIYASIGIPITDRDGHMLAWCYRRTAKSPDWQPRYLYTAGVDIRDLWFGTQFHSGVLDIVIVEGALDAIWCDQNGIPALALLGATMGERKLSWLTHYRSVTLLGDLDSGGAAAVQRIGQAIGHIVPVRVAQYHDWMRAKDPQELSPVDLELVVARAVPWPLYEVRAKQ